MGDVANAEGDGIGVEAGIGKWQGLGIAADPFDGLLAFLLRPPHPLAQHLLVDVADRHLGVAASAARHLGNAKSDVAGAAGHVQHLPAGPRVEPLHHGIFPDAVDTGAHQVVHQVIARGDAGKDLFDQAFFLAFRHLAEAETCGFFRHGRNIAARPRPRLPSLPQTR